MPRRLHVVLAIVSIGALIAVWLLWGRRYATHLRDLHRQHTLMTHTLPQDKVVYESDPKRAAQLLSGPEYAPARPPWADLAEPDKPPAFYLPPGIRAFIDRPAAEGIAFMHQLRIPGGPERLVVVWIDYAPALSQEYLELRPMICVPASWHPRSTLRRRSHSLGLQINDYDKRHRFRLFAGQPDPQDPSHFTIAYSFQDKPGLIDGYLRKAGPDSDLRDHPFGDVYFKVRSGPLRSWVASEQRTSAEGVPKPPP